MPETVTVALIGAAGLVLVAIIGLLSRVTFQVTRVRRDAADTKEQLVNHHSTNMRVEQDERHLENTQAIAEITEKLDRGFDEMRMEFRALWGKAGSNADRIKELENTHPTKRGRHAS